MTEKIPNKIIPLVREPILDPNSDISPHIPSILLESSKLPVTKNLLREEARCIPFEGKPSLEHASDLAKGFSGHQFAPKACEEASKALNSSKSGPDNDNLYSDRAGVHTP
jgi:hypothetical protein